MVRVNGGRNSPETQLVTSSNVRLWQEVVLKFRYNLPMNNIKRNKHVKKILLVERDGQFKSDTQSLEDFVYFKVSESQWLPTIHLAARFWTASSKAQSLAVWGFHTTQAYSIHGLTMLLYATSFASAEHPNIVLRKIQNPCGFRSCQFTMVRPC